MLIVLLSISACLEFSAANFVIVILQICPYLICISRLKGLSMLIHLL